MALISLALSLGAGAALAQAPADAVPVPPSVPVAASKALQPASAARPAASNPAQSKPQLVQSRPVPQWHELTPAQQSILAPLAKEWTRMEPARRQKWIEIAVRFPQLNPAEQQRVTERMRQWAVMPADQRNAARITFESLRGVDQAQRSSKWEAYQSLSSEERQKWAESAQATQARRTKAGKLKPTAPSASAAKVLPKAPVLQVAPTTVLAGPGLTTRSITKPAQPARYIDPVTGLLRAESVPHPASAAR